MRYLGARVFVGVGRARGQLVRGAMDVGVLVLVELGDAVDDALRLLRGGGVVEPDQRVAVDLFAQDGKIVADGANFKLLPGQLEVAYFWCGAAGTGLVSTALDAGAVGSAWLRK